MKLKSNLPNLQRELPDGNFGSKQPGAAHGETHSHDDVVIGLDESRSL
jgi:hypothetical protein